MDSVLSVVNRSNQRGGRMLSVVDLLEAGTLTVRQLCWLLARIEEGASWLVGARPGGAGKTTVMSALLAMLPAKERVWVTNPGSGWESCAAGDCVVAFEISRGLYDGYIWGPELAQMCALGEAGCRIVANLHADTLAEARDKIVGAGSVPEKRFQAFDLFIPIQVDRPPSRVRRRVPRLHHVVQGAWIELDLGNASPSERENEIATFLGACATKGWRTVSDVRQAWLAWCQAWPA